MCRSGHGKGDLLIAPHAGGQHFAVQLLVGLFREIVHIPSGTWDIAAATRVPRPAPEGAATPVPPDRAVPRRLPFAGAPLGHEVMRYIVEAVWAQFVVRGRTSSSRGSSSAAHVIAEGRLRGPGAAGSLSVVGTLGPFGTRRCIRKRATGKGTVCDVVMPLMLVLGA